MQSLVERFRKLNSLPEKRLEVMERMQRFGSIGLSQLVDIVENELSQPLGDYRQAFAQAAAAEGVKKLDAGILPEIAKVRSEVLALSKKEDLKKEDILKTADPGLARLKKLILFSREDVLQKHPELARRREALQLLGRQWEKCAELLLVTQAEEDEREKTEKKEKEKADAEAKAKAKTKAEGDAQEEAEEIALPSFEKYLVKEEEMAAALAMPMDDQTRLTLAANAQLAGRLDLEEGRCILDLNLTRSLLGLRAVQIDPALAAVARDHAGDMQTLKFFSHESPVPGKKTPKDRAKRFGVSYSGENIAMGEVDGTEANRMWWHSPGHLKNMLASHSRVGVGRSGSYWTEMVGD